MENHEKSARGVALPAVRKERTSRPELDGATRYVSDAIRRTYRKRDGNGKGAHRVTEKTSWYSDERAETFGM